jgi:hypothetical protein
MRQLVDTISMLPPVFPLDRVGCSFGRADRRPEHTLRVRNSRFILCSAGNSSASRRAATARIAASAEAYAESSMACCSGRVLRCLGQAGCR